MPDPIGESADSGLALSIKSQHRICFLKVISMPTKAFLKKFLALALLSIMLCCGCGIQNAAIPQSTAAVITPIFTDPAVKLAEVASSGFTTGLVNEAIDLKPGINAYGNQIHMGYWSGGNNRAYLVNTLNSINAPSSSAVTNIAIWDEGVNTSSSYQYPAYITMNYEYWYERVSEVNHILIVNGVSYVDPYTVTLANANDIWGGYSQRYADMTTYFYEKTGNKVKAWCFVQGAYANRVFYTYELPQLRILEAAGVVTVYFAQNNNADWRNPADWLVGTENAPIPRAFSYEPIRNIYER